MVWSALGTWFLFPTPSFFLWVFLGRIGPLILNRNPMAETSSRTSPSFFSDQNFSKIRLFPQNLFLPYNLIRFVNRISFNITCCHYHDSRSPKFLPFSSDKDDSSSNRTSSLTSSSRSVTPSPKLFSPPTSFSTESSLCLLPIIPSESRHVNLVPQLKNRYTRRSLSTFDHRKRRERAPTS